MRGGGGPLVFGLSVLVPFYDRLFGFFDGWAGDPRSENSGHQGGVGGSPRLSENLKKCQKIFQYSFLISSNSQELLVLLGFSQQL